MKMRTDLNGAVAGVGNFEFCRVGGRHWRHGIVRKKIFAWNHRFVTCAIRRELANRMMHGHELGAVGKGSFDLDSRRSSPARLPSHLRGFRMVSAEFHQFGNGRPSRMPSRISAVISATASG